MNKAVQTLLVEDESTDIATLTAYLQQEVPGIDLSVANNINDAKSLASKHPFSIVIIDHSLPDGSGLELLTHLKTIDHPAISIFEIPSGDYKSIREALKQGASRTVIKDDGYWECLPALIEQSLAYENKLDAQRDSFQLFSGALNALQEGILLVDNDDTILFANPPMQHIAGESHDKLIGQNRKQTPLNVSAATKTLDRIIYDDNNVILGRVEVYSQAAGAKKDLSNFEEELDQMRDRMMSRISHEVKTPLTSVLGFSHMMVTRPDAPLEKREKWANFIHTKSEALNRIVDNILDLNAIYDGKLTFNSQDTNIGELVQKAVDERRELEPERLIDLKIADQLPPIPVDPDRIEQAIDIMINIACKATPLDIPVVVTVRQSGISANVPDNKLDSIEIGFTDRGMSLDAENRAHVFDPFSAEPGATYQPGKGLWLSLAKAIVDAHQGKMWIDSSPGQGNTFYLSLPLTRQHVR